MSLPPPRAPRDPSGRFIGAPSPAHREAAASRSSPAMSSNAESNASRADKFEHEKRRLIETCFSRTVEGSDEILESYIIHVRVQEDAQYPQSPPPPESNPKNKKPRVIVVAVKNTGVVRLHKARENGNGTFSIGKTWPLDELAGIQSYSHLLAQTSEVQQHKEWAGDLGFLIKMSKEYYWQAGTAKEKEYFLGSLVKIYMKYTKGKIPALDGFDPEELRQFLKGTPYEDKFGQRGSPQPAQGLPSNPRGPGMAAAPSPMLPPNGQRQPSAQRPRPPAAFPPGTAPPPLAQSRDPSRQLRPQPPPEQALRSPSRDNVYNKPPIPPQLAAAQRLTPQSSRSDFPSQRSETPDSFGSRGSTDRRAGSRPSESTEDLSQSNASSVFTRSRQTPSDQRPTTAQSQSSSLSRNDDPTDDRRIDVLPERRRPPIVDRVDSDTLSISRSENSDRFTTPLASPGPGRSKDMPGAYVSEQSTPRRTPEPVKSPVPVPGRFSPQAEEPPTAPLPAPPVTSPAAAPATTPIPTSTQATTQGKALTEQSSDPAIMGPMQSPPVVSPLQSPQGISPLQSPTSGDETYRPGLGPMVKKKGAAGETLRKAANAYGAFKPRAGGAAQRLWGLKANPNEPDGIHAVVPAPLKSPVPPSPFVMNSAPETPVDSPTVQTPQSYEKKDISSSVAPTVPAVSTATPENVPAVTVSSPKTAAPPVQPVPAATLHETQADRAASPQKEEEKKKAEGEKRKRRRSMQQVSYLDNLGVDASLLEGRGLEFEATLAKFGWGNSALQTKKLEVIEADLRRELGRVEAGSWLGHLEQKDDRVETVEKMLDKAIAECEELEGLLTLYNVELSSLNDDIAFIEAQGQGLQVQTANQKLLQSELHHLVETLSITPDQLEALRRAPIGKKEGLQAVEGALLLLYNAMRTIDPTLRTDVSVDLADASKRTSTFGNNELSNMRALREKTDAYQGESHTFMARLKQHMDMTFGAAKLDTKDALQNKTGSGKPTDLDIGAHDLARAALWQYSPILLFAKEVDPTAWEGLLKVYQKQLSSVFQDELRDNKDAWRRLGRKATGEEQDLLFTTPQEKENESLSTTARKLTVKRSQTLARGLRSANADRSIDKQADKLWPYQAFAGALDGQIPVIFTEQNFIVDLFHATSAEHTDFADAVVSIPVDARRGTNLYERKPFEPDRAMASKVMEVMEEEFSTWGGYMQELVDWALKTDPLQGVGILGAINKKLLELEDTNQDFLTRALQKLNERLGGLFNKFVEEQLRAIEETKVKIKKRKGVIAFMKIFPLFSAAIENMLPSYEENDRLEVRTMVDDAYKKINKAMFESLKVIAKESPTVMAGQGQNDPEDKEALNYHILLIENMNHYVEEVDERGDPVLGEWRTKAQGEMNEHLTLYVDAVIRRPLGKLLDFLESTETLQNNLNPGVPATSIAGRTSHSSPVFKKIISSYDSKETRKGIDALRKRVEKHFGDADDPGLSRNLVAKVLKECEVRYLLVLERTNSVGRTVYSGEVMIEFKKEEVEAWFKR